MKNKTTTSQSRKFNPGQVVFVHDPAFGHDVPGLVLDKVRRKEDARVLEGTPHYDVLFVAQHSDYAVVMRMSAQAISKTDIPPMCPFVRAEYPMHTGMFRNRFTT